MSRYNVGAGNHFKVPGWVPIDHQTSWYQNNPNNFVEYDMMLGGRLPIEDNSADIIYTSHTIEHIKEGMVIKFFSEAFRSLRPGGMLRITTPDVLLSYAALCRNDADWFYWDKDYLPKAYYNRQYLSPLAERWLDYVASPLNPNNKAPNSHKLNAEAIHLWLAEMGMGRALDYFTGLCEYNGEFAGNHISWWTASKLKDILVSIGFSEAYESAQNQSRALEIRTPHFDATVPEVSLFVEAIK